MLITNWKESPFASAASLSSCLAITAHFGYFIYIWNRRSPLITTNLYLPLLFSLLLWVYNNVQHIYCLLVQRRQLKARFKSFSKVIVPFRCTINDFWWHQSTRSRRSIVLGSALLVKVLLRTLSQASAFVFLTSRFLSYYYYIFNGPSMRCTLGVALRPFWVSVPIWFDPGFDIDTSRLSLVMLGLMRWWLRQKGSTKVPLHDLSSLEASPHCNL